MTVTLLKEALMHDADEHLTELPRWVRPRDGAKYWHIPRTARVVDKGYRGERMISVSFWCGVGRWVLEKDCTDKTPREMICGTCEGRARGFEGDGGLIFRPRSDFDFPKLCPSTDTRGDVCAFCGEKPRYRRSYVHYDEKPHVAGALLARFAPCPKHGWKFIASRDGRLVCGVPWAKCGHVLEATDV